MSQLAAESASPSLLTVNDIEVIYDGAIDDKRSTNPADVKGANNYVRAALTEATAGKPVTVASTTPYGCTMKY